MDGNEMHPIAYLVHERKTKEAHTTFLKQVCGLLDLNSHITIVTDREAAFMSYFLSYDQTKDNHFCCTNHIQTDVELYAKKHFGTEITKEFKSDISALINTRSLSEYRELKCEIENYWDPKLSD